MKSIYKSESGKKAVLALYDEQLSRLTCPWQDLYVETSFGRTHLIKTGNPQGIPLLVFHGGNATTACNLLSCSFLLRDFHIFAVDTIGHPGKSAETCLSPRGYDYGKWTGEVIAAIGFHRIRCFGGSYGAGVLAKAMCAAPESIEKAVLLVPAGIHNAPAVCSVTMLFPMLMYLATRKDKWLRKCILPMAVTEDCITPEIWETAKCTFDHVKVKTGMPSNVTEEKIARCVSPVLVMAGEKDCLFPARGVIPRAEEIIPDCATYLLKKRGHMGALAEKEKQMIIDFLR